VDQDGIRVSWAGEPVGALRQAQGTQEQTR
jgi:hypothetical protein